MRGIAEPGAPHRPLLQGPSLGRAEEEEESAGRKGTDIHMCHSTGYQNTVAEKSLRCWDVQAP